MKSAKYAIACAVLLCGSGLAANASACTVDGWSADAGVPANGVSDSPPAVPRFSELCAFGVTGASHVQSNFASDTRYRARFYVLDGLTGSGAVDIFRAYGDEVAGSLLFKVAFNGTTFTFDATGAGGTSASAPAASGDWNLVEVDWNSNDGTFRFWVNADAGADAASGSASSGTGTVESVRLGAPDGLGSQAGGLVFDAFESHRETAVGPLVNCDAEGDGGDIDINDVLAVVDEVFGNASILGAGQPDCEADGDVDITDALAIVDIVF